MRDLAKEVGKLVRNTRKAKGFSQEHLADLADIDRSYMGRIERGEVNVTVKALWEISRALSVPLVNLIPRG